MPLRGGGNPRRIARIKLTSRSGRRYQAPAAAESPDQGGKESPGAALEAARRPDARQFAHKEAQIRGTDVDEQALEHVGVSAQMHAAQSPGFVEVGVGTLEPFTPLAQQALPAGAPNAPPVGVDGRAGVGLVAPVAPTAIRLRHVAADSQLGQRNQDFVGVVALVADHLGEAGAGRRPESHPLASGGQERTRILVLDDDPQTLRYVRDALAAAGYSPLVTANPRELSHLVQTKQPRLVLLDLMLPGTDGIELMQCIPELADLPVIFISGYGRDETIARALEIGATDYIVKPFSATELTARVRAALRRHGEPEPFRLGDLTIHYEQRRVTVAGRAVHLTATEFELLRVLSLNPRAVLT